jgi:hypothetical protein
MTDRLICTCDDDPANCPNRLHRSRIAREEPLAVRLIELVADLDPPRYSVEHRGTEAQARLMDMGSGKVEELGPTLAALLSAGRRAIAHAGSSAWWARARLVHRDGTVEDWMPVLAWALVAGGEEVQPVVIVNAPRMGTAMIAADWVWEVDGGEIVELRHSTTHPDEASPPVESNPRDEPAPQ